MTPLRRPLQRDDLDVELTAAWFKKAAPEIELGWSLLRQAMREAGWPARMPEGDRKPSNGHPVEPSAIDYNDPTGEQAVRLENLADDLDELQGIWRDVAHGLRAMARITRGHVLPAVPARPQCSLKTCDAEVERTAGGGYRGMEQIAGHWVAKVGVEPVCERHRFASRRSA